MALIKKKEDKTLNRYLEAYNGSQTQSNANLVGLENKNTIENKVQIPVQNNNTGNNIDIIEQQPLKNAYDNMKAQLELDKVSAQNELANAGKLAKTYMDNYLKYYGMQGSGMGQSAYANLAAKQTQGLADINKEYSRDLSDYRNTFNQGLQTQAAEDMLTMTPEQQQTYIDKLRGQSGVDEQTLSNIQSKANAINYEKEQAKNESVLANGENYAATFSDDKWDAYLSRLENEGVSQDTIQTLKDIRDYYGVSSFETTQENALSSIEVALEQALADNNVSKIDSLRLISDKISNATTKEELDKALSELEDLENANIGTKYPEEVGADSGNGTNANPYLYKDKDLSSIEKLVKENKIPEGSWVQYTNSLGKEVKRQVLNGKLTNKKENVPTSVNAIKLPDNSLYRNHSKVIEENNLKEGDYVYVGTGDYNHMYKVTNGKLKMAGFMKDYNILD